MTRRMIFKSHPSSPGAIALLGDYAVQQNTQNRSDSTLNSVMDTRFRPRHEAWTALWVTQQQREDALTAVLDRRNVADENLHLATKRVLRVLELNLGEGSPVIKQYVPDASLAVCNLPLYRELTALEPYADAIAKASDTLIPADVRAQFAAALEQARQVLAEADAAEKAMVGSQRARAAADPDWRTDYGAYHRAVEFVSDGDRRLIGTWILEWPLKQSRTKASSSASTTADTDDATNNAQTPSSTGSDNTSPA